MPVWKKALSQKGSKGGTTPPNNKTWVHYSKPEARGIINWVPCLGVLSFGRGAIWAGKSFSEWKTWPFSMVNGTPPSRGRRTVRSRHPCAPARRRGSRWPPAGRTPTRPREARTESDFFVVFFARTRNHLLNILCTKRGDLQSFRLPSISRTSVGVQTDNMTKKKVRQSRAKFPYCKVQTSLSPPFVCEI